MSIAPRESGRVCETCRGTGEHGTDCGVTDCPDCGGVGSLPDPMVLAEWRIGDIQRTFSQDNTSVGSDVRWLVAELRRARKALTEVVTLSHERESEQVLAQISVTAGEALSLYRVMPTDDNN